MLTRPHPPAPPPSGLRQTPFVLAPRAIDMPYRFSASPTRDLLPPRALGQHTIEILRAEGGLSDEEIGNLVDAEAVKAHGRA